jgi:hypothetical protein
LGEEQYKVKGEIWEKFINRRKERSGRNAVIGERIDLGENALIGERRDLGELQ